MRKLVVLSLALALVSLGVGAAFANVQARDALVVYTGTDAFTKLTTSERRYCLEWLVEGGPMRLECKRAVVRLLAIAPGAITEEQRQALTLAVSDVPPPPPPPANAPVISERNDEAAAAVFGGLVGLVAGLVIANNSGRHHYAPGPPPPRAIQGPPRRGPGGPGPGGPRGPGGPGGPRFAPPRRGPGGPGGPGGPPRR